MWFCNFVGVLCCDGVGSYFIGEKVVYLVILVVRVVRFVVSWLYVFFWCKFIYFFMEIGG